MRENLELFVPGRLCLFGEHSDWAGMYRTVNADVTVGEAIVTGIEQGIYATVTRDEKFVVTSSLAFYQGEELECEMDTEALLAIAQKGGFFSYVAGVAAYINDNYSVGGVRIEVTKMDLPLKSGLSSSAAICVLVARAFNRLYHLRMNTQGEMQAAFRGEQKTPSRCGRLDQACAYGTKPVLMEFDGVEITSRELRLGSTFYWVIANLMAKKDTIRILADLNKCFPYADNEVEQKVQEALGVDNRIRNQKVISCLEGGDPEGLGALMNEAQENFDRKVMPACTELKAPVLHETLRDPKIAQWIYGGKGVGSQGDGTVQFLCKSQEDAEELKRYLEEEKGMDAFSLTLKPGQTIKKAVIPLAGFGTRVFPATKGMKKCFLPVPDTDGMLKPSILILLEQLMDAGIEEICLIIGEDEQEEFDRFFEPLEEHVFRGLSREAQAEELRIREIRRKITFVYQRERLGFGHAVYLTKNFTKREPVLLLLGDFLYRSDIDVSCCKQVMDAYTECGKLLVSITEVNLRDVPHYGIIHGQWSDENEEFLLTDGMVEKPTDDYAEQYLGVINNRKEKKYYATFGQYVLTPEVYEELENEIRSGKPSEGREYGLTAALERVRNRTGMIGFLPKGTCYDIGLPEQYRRTVMEYGK